MPITAQSGFASFNPFRCGGTSLPVPVLLMAKLIAIAFLFTSPDSLLPRVVLISGTIALLLNCWVRVCCLLMGGIVLFALATSAGYDGQDKAFCAALLILAGLYIRRTNEVLIRLLVAITYAGSALAFGPYNSWLRHAMELGAAFAILIPALTPLAVWLTVLLQCGLLFVTGGSVSMFFYGMQAAMFALLRWPDKPLLVIFDGACGFCDWTREQITRFDLERVFEWVPYQTGRGREYGITDERASRRFQLVTKEGKVLEGFHALRRMLGYLPAVWLALFVLVAIAPDAWSTWRRIVAGATLFFVSPLMNPLGVAAYDLVARNRHRIFPGRTCKLPATTSR